MQRKQFISKEERYYSLLRWRQDEADFDRREIALAGFYFPDESDDKGRLRCGYCNIVVSNWAPNDNPWEVHLEFANKPCDYVLRYKGEDFVHQCLDRIQENEIFSGIDESEGQVDTESFSLLGLQETATIREQKTSQEVMRSISGRMANPDERLKSFDRACHEERKMAQVLADSGFYFEGNGPSQDSVRCFSCHTTLYDIREDDDIWIEHARWKTCRHVEKKKGLEFVLAVKGSKPSNQREHSAPAPDSNASESGNDEPTGAPIINQQRPYKKLCTRSITAKDDQGIKRKRGARIKERSLDRNLKNPKQYDHDAAVSSTAVTNDVKAPRRYVARSSNEPNDLRRYQAEEDICHPAVHGGEDAQTVYLCCGAQVDRRNERGPCSECGKNWHFI